MDNDAVRAELEALTHDWHPEVRAMAYDTLIRYDAEEADILREIDERLGS